jgi:single-strand DNA-binding protein
MSINKVIITGNLTRDPELRSLPSGLAVLNMGVAVNDRRKNQQTGEWEEHPNFVDVTVFGARGEALTRFLSKGSKVAIEGKLRWSSWETQQGEKRSKLEVVADEVEFLSSRDGGSGGGGGFSGGGAASSPAPVSDPTDGDEIPF